MNTKRFILLFSVIIISLGAVIYFLYDSLKETREELIRANSNVSSLLTDVDSFRTKHNELVSTTKDLQLNIKELKTYNSDLLQQLKSLGVKPKNTSSVSEGVVTINVTDTVYLKEEGGVFTGTYHDTWTDADFSVKDTLLSFSYTTKDSLMIVMYGQKERFNILHPFKKRITSYYTLAKLTRPNSSVVVKSVQFK